jgi:hypothetical protein
MTDKKPRRTRSDSAAAAIRAAENAVKPDLEPPESHPLTADEMPFFRDIARGRARDDWREVDLQIVAQLARVMAKIERFETRLSNEEPVIDGKPNPLISVIGTYRAMQGSMMRTLQLGGRVAVDPRNLHKARDLENQARKTADQVAAEDNALLAD